MIAAEVLDEIAEGQSPYARLLPGSEPPEHVEQWCAPDCHCGRLLRIDGINQTVVYRIGDYQFMPECYTAEWPD
jgi:hypothetical protein